MKKTTHIALLLCAAIIITIPAFAEDEPAGIADNSFLLEEAYNQEAGVVQFINMFQYNTQAQSWQYILVNEWPLFGQTNQLSYSLPVVRNKSAVGLGDLALNYRLQILRNDFVSMAPRLSVIFPTGNNADGNGTGGWGIQFNWTVSINISKMWESHVNVGGTITIAAKNAAGQTANPGIVNYGASIIFKPLPWFNLLCEFAGTAGDVIGPTGSIDKIQTMFINPGIRFAINVTPTFQIAPRICVPIGLGSSMPQIAVLGYLSFEGKLW